SRIDLEQRVAGLDLLALGEVDLDDLTVDPAFHRDGVEGLNGADAADVDRHVARLGGAGRYRHRRVGRRRRRRVAAAGIAVSGPAEGRHDDDNPDGDGRPVHLAPTHFFIRASIAHANAPSTILYARSSSGLATCNHRASTDRRAARSATTPRPAAETPSPVRRGCG